MKITIVGPAYPYRGGIALFSNRLAEALVSGGHEVNIVTFKLQYPSFLFPGKTQFSSDTIGSDLNITRTINSVNPFNWIKVGKEIEVAKPDLVIFKYWMPFMAPCFGVIAKHIKKNKTTKIIAVVHNLIPHEKRMGDTGLTNYFVKKMDGFIAMSKSVLTDIEQFNAVKPKMISPHPLYDNFGVVKSREESLKALGLDAQYNYMLFFGIIRKYKGLDLLLNAFADKKLNNGSIKLIVAGEFYDDEGEYLDIIKKHQLQDSVILTKNFVPDNEVVNYFCGADIIVQPYRNATQSGVTQIAYHFDKPMLVTDVGGLKEIVPHNKVGYVVQRTASEIVKALIDFYQNNRAAEFIEGVKEEKKKYSWQIMVDTINELYNKL
ncbi:MAG: glycosyl transferase family 1 [Flavobacteriales bacterium]|nr:MAG: glycosyl transferase family 1 [Flavobacteriales bacterium]